MLHEAKLGLVTSTKIGNGVLLSNAPAAQQPGQARALRASQMARNIRPVDATIELRFLFCGHAPAHLRARRMADNASCGGSGLRDRKIPRSLGARRPESRNAPGKMIRRKLRRPFRRVRRVLQLE